MNEYVKSPKMIGGTVYCNEKSSVEELKSMGIDRRWNEDNRVLTWTFGLVNAGFDQHFIHNGQIINDTDDRVQFIVDKNLDESEEITGWRNIRHNGSWMRIEHLIDQESTSESQSM